MFEKEVLLDSDHLSARLLGELVSRIYHGDGPYRKALAEFYQWDSQVAFMDLSFERKYQSLLLANGEVEYWATFLNYVYGVELYVSGSRFQDILTIPCLMDKDLMLDDTFRRLAAQQQKEADILRKDGAISLEKTKIFLAYQQQFQDAIYHRAAVLGYQDCENLWQYMGQFRKFLEQVAAHRHGRCSAK